MNKYEIMFIVKTSIESDTVNKTVEDLKKIFNKPLVKEMGQKKLAYPIKKELSGYYYLFTVETNAEQIDKFRHLASINDNVLRHLIVKLDEE